MRHLFALCALLTLVTACGGEAKPKPEDAGAVADVGALDAGLDGGAADSGPADTGSDDSAGGDDTADAGPEDSGAPDTGPADAGPKDKGPVWNVLVYMAGDNNLEKSGILDMKEMLSLPPSDNLIFHVQTDRAQGFYKLGLGELKDWEGTKRVVIKDGKIQELKDLGEVNMGKAESLRDFIEWGTAVVKADRTMLILWDHGHAWRGYGGDDFDKDELHLDEIVTGIKDGLAKAGMKQFDLLGFDACLMGDIAVIRALKDYAPWFLASEDLEPSHGWDYTSFQEVIDHPEDKPDVVGKAIVSGYKKQAKSEGKFHSITLALYEVAKLPAVEVAFAEFVKAIHDGILGDDGKPSATAPLLLTLEKARAKVQRFGRSADPSKEYHMVDIVDLADELAKKDKAFKGNLKDLEDALDDLVSKKVYGPLTKGSNGLSFYFPSAEEYYEKPFDKISGFDKWREVLDAMYGGGKLAKDQAPKFDTKKGCKDCAVGAGMPEPTCGKLGALGAKQKLTKESAAKTVKAELLVGYQGLSGELQVVSKVPAKVDEITGEVSAEWNQQALIISQGGRTALLTTETVVDGVDAIHEVPVVIAGPAKCACTLPGDPGFADTDGDGVANCVDKDDDGDGVPDDKDVCPFVPDQAQADSNKDGKGDACDSNANTPTVACTPDPAEPFGPERDGVILVVTHQVTKLTLAYGVYVKNQGGIAEEDLKSYHRIRPLVMKSSPSGDWTWAPGEPLAMRPDQPLSFRFQALTASFQTNASGNVETDASGEPVNLKKSLGFGDLFMQLLVTGVGGHGDGVYWKGSSDSLQTPCPPVDPAEGLCPAGQVVDCKGTCWPEALWGDGTCHAGQNGGPDFYCEARAFDKGACTAPACPAGLGLVRDCNGACIAAPSMKGDKTCHSGQTAAIPDLACPKFDYDGGDCPCANDCHGHGTCNAGKCECKGNWSGDYCQVPPTCGDGKCNGVEQCGTCPGDCGKCGTSCGNGTCEPGLGEDCNSCAQDCGACSCGDGVCTPGKEDCTSCAKDCGACPVCGDEVCDVWTEGATFPKDKGERCDTCPNDCGACQGECCTASNAGNNNAYVGGGCSDAKVTACVCAKDPSCCVYGWSAKCVALAEKDCALNCCKPSCSGKECGGDGCGGVCGTCDDGNPCTADTCGKDGKCAHKPTPGPCDDGDACTIASSCKDGKCAKGAPKCDDSDKCATVKCQQGACVTLAGKVCDDGNPCTDDACDPAVGCTVTNNTASCDDGDPCTGLDTCKDGKCAAGKGVACDDGNVCTTDSCDGKKGGCVSLPNSATCTDGNPCTKGDACKGGICGTGAWLDCDDKNPCTTDSCDAGGKGCTHANNTAGCDDGDACTVGDLCAGGSCGKGKAVSCNDGNACTDDACDPKTGCASLPNKATCTDGSACTKDDACAGGKCVPGKVLDCDDGEYCTLDACNTLTGCVHTNSTEMCTDGDACTFGDVCKDGKCTKGKVAGCNDGNACTDDACDPKTGCTFTNNTKPCSDGDACTSGDVCKDGKCVVTPVVCTDDGDKCTTETCDKNSGKCQSTSKDCSGGSPCVTGTCNAGTGACSTANKADGTTCDDGDACTTGTTCKTGKCGVPTVCNDNKPCTADTCDKTKGCVFTPLKDGASCDDGDFCTTGEVCGSGSCAGGKPTVCADDGNPCTVEACSAGKCGSTAKVCDDKDPCTTDSCDKVLGCLALAGNNGATCEDNDKCTTGTTCSGGTCGAKTDCDDSNPCTADTCDKATGCKNTPMKDGDACDDGVDKCNGSVCAAGKCAAGTKATDCDDSDPCSTDSCDKTKGCLHVAAKPPSKVKNVWTVSHSNNAAVYYGSISVDDWGNAYVTHGDNWHLKIDDKTKKVVWQQYKKVRGISAYKDKVYGNTKNQVVEIDPDTGAIKTLFNLPNTYFYRSHVDSDGYIWATSHVNPKSGRYTPGGVKVGGVASGNVYNGWGVTTYKGTVYTTYGYKTDNFVKAKAYKPGGFSGSIAIQTQPSAIAASDDGTIYVCDPGAGNAMYLLAPDLSSKTLVAGQPCVMVDIGPDGSVYRYYAKKIYKDTINNGACDDSDACTTEQCLGAKCVKVAVDCDDKNQCTKDSCDPKAAAGKGCSNVNLADGTACDDGTVCTSKDSCQAGSCKGTPLDCDDGIPCTKDACDPVTGCDNGPKVPSLKITGDGKPSAISGNGHILADKTGAYWYGHGGNGGNGHINRFTKTGGLAKKVSGYNYQFTGFGFVDGKLYSAFKGDINLVDKSALTRSKVAVNGHTTTTDLASDNEGALWVAGDKGILKMKPDGTQLTKPTYQSGNRLESNGNELLIYNKNGTSAVKVDLTGKVLKTYTTDKKILSGAIHPGGIVALTTNDAQYDKHIRFFDLDGKEFHRVKGMITIDTAFGADGGFYYTVNLGGYYRVRRNDFLLPTCDDGDACTDPDACMNGKCVPLPKTCNDGNVCTNDSCDKAKGCVFTPTAKGSACNDGNACTDSDACDNGTCKGTAKVCDDKTPCTTDSCNPATGCVFTDVPAKAPTGVWNHNTASDRQSMLWAGGSWAADGSFYTCNGENKYFWRWCIKIDKDGKSAGHKWSKTRAIAPYGGKVYGFGTHDTDANKSVYGTIDDVTTMKITPTWDPKPVAFSPRKFMFDKTGAIWATEGSVVRKRKSADGTIILTAQGKVSPTYALDVVGDKVYYTTDVNEVRVIDLAGKALSTTTLSFALGDIAAHKDGSAYVIERAGNYKVYALNKALTKATVIPNVFNARSLSVNPANGDLVVQTNKSVRQVKVNLSDCDDGDKCTEGDACIGGACEAQAKCDDGNPCTIDACNKADGKCSVSNAAKGVACGAGKSCDGAGKCETTVAAGWAKKLFTSGIGEHICALKHDDSLVCWGRNGSGQAGIGAKTNGQSKPKAVAGMTGVLSAAIGRGHTCAVKSDNKTYCWGTQKYGGLGDGQVGSGNILSPKLVSIAPAAKAVYAGQWASCVMDLSDKMHCWGYVGSRLPTGSSPGIVHTATPVVGFPADKLVSVGIGYESGCAATSKGEVYCFGLNFFKQAANSATTSFKVATKRTDVTGIAWIGHGHHHHCAYGASKLFCWGRNDKGQLGIGSVVSPTAAATQVAGLSGELLGVLGTPWHTVALTKAGKVFTTGQNDKGQLGDGKTSASPTTSFTAATAFSGTYSQIGAMHHATCALGVDGEVYCVGSNQYGGLGDGTTTDSAALKKVLAP